MIKLLSIHIPKTAGTSFYHVLEQVYSEGLSPSLKRRNITGSIEEKVDISQFRIVHGHVTWEEAAPFCEKEKTKVICWLRNPVDRVLSNYRFFIDRLENPERNLKLAEINRHRIHESPLEYASREENRNRMSKFIAGLAPEDLFFIGLVECFDQDLHSLAKLLSWPHFEYAHLNKAATLTDFSDDIRASVANLNAEDMDLYSRVVAMKANHPKCLPLHDA